MPLCWCSAPPSSYVDRDAYERVAGAILDDLAAQMPLDGIYLDLHGAMVAEHHEDGEGELLRRIRALVGEAMPIVASLDYHTNMTADMVRHASAMSATAPIRMSTWRRPAAAPPCCSTGCCANAAAL